MPGMIPTMIMIDGFGGVSGEAKAIDNIAQANVATEGTDAPVDIYIRFISII